MKKDSVERRDRREGQSLVEFAFVFPFMVLLIANVVNFAGLFYAGITVVNAARHGSQYWVLAGASVGGPAPPSAALIHDLITKDTLPLLNKSSLAVRACREDKATGTPVCNTFGTGTYTNPPLDARTESPLYVMAWVDIAYDYEPYIALFTVPVLGIPLSPPPQLIQRQSVMRMLQ